MAPEAPPTLDADQPGMTPGGTAAGAYLQFLVNPPPLPTRPGDDSSTIENARTTITLLNAYIDSCTMHIEQARGERDHALEIQRRATTQSDAAYQALQLATAKNDDLSDSNAII